uniref:ferredoxin thioredoxin reductase, beta chain n=1 Tax=Ascoseira mirabilis TaxID=76830 RepID=UPI00300120F0|nr:ferredoxin thioredoxin reductase, beta chain [Ascoseira mirabilis]
MSFEKIKINILGKGIITLKSQLDESFVNYMVQAEQNKQIFAMQIFAETYAKQTNTFFCLDPSLTSIVIAGLAKYKNKYGLPLCPCRNYHSEKAEIELNYWICPCVSMRERKECHCKLFMQPDERGVSKIQDLSLRVIYKNIEKKKL